MPNEAVKKIDPEQKRRADEERIKKGSGELPLIYLQYVCEI